MKFIENLKNRAGRYSSLYALAMLILFWTIFDSTMQYITPLLIEWNGFSNTMIGVIIGSSSVSGAIFDFLICKFFKKVYFRRVLLLMLALCLVYPLLLWQAKTLWFYLIVMAIWGLYFDLYGFGSFDFVSRFMKKKEHSSGFGVLQVSRSLGTLIAPLIIGFVIIDIVKWKILAFSWSVLLIAIFFFVVLLLLSSRQPEVINVKNHRNRNILKELYLWRRLGFGLLPILILTFFIFLFEAFFWTLAPLYAETSLMKSFGGLLLAAYSLPAVFLGWFVGSLTARFGKKRTAFFSFFVGSIILSSFYLSPSPAVSLVIVFATSCFVGIALPSLNSLYSNYISQLPENEGEIEGLEDMSFNMGYAFGPLAAGILSDFFTIPLAFSILGAIGALVSLLLFRLAPDGIVLKKKL